jgi:hypothetical protein
LKKFCPKRTFSYKGLNDKEVTADYVAPEDVLNFHGKEFYDQWSSYMSNVPKLMIDSKPNIYFEDYKFYAYRTSQYLNS